MKPIPAFLPVIHVQDDQQAIEQTGVAVQAGALGVFLIDHRRTHKRLIESYEAVRHQFPELWIGLNFLDLNTPSAIYNAPFSCDAIQVDDVRDTPASCPRPLGWDRSRMRVFAGTAFKYRPPHDNLAQDIIANAVEFGVVVTSGEATGEAASLEKIKDFSSTLYEAPRYTPLALASGVSLENLGQYTPFVDIFMVSTHISLDMYHLDPEKVAAMASAINESPSMIPLLEIK